MQEWEEHGLPAIDAALFGYDRIPYRQIDARTRRIILERPDDDAAMRIVCNCMRDVGTRRTALGAVLAVMPWDVVMDWCDRHEVPGDIARVVWEAIYLIESDRVSRAIAELKTKE